MSVSKKMVWTDADGVSQTVEFGTTADNVSLNDGTTLSQTLNTLKDKRTATFVIGTTQAGHTIKDCDYLCDGTADQVEINAAIQALPANGGEIFILEGTYNIADIIVVNKDNVAITGTGNSTILRKTFNTTTQAEWHGCMDIQSNYCTLSNIQFNSQYSGSFNAAILINANYASILNITISNYFRGIYIKDAKNCMISDNAILVGSACIMLSNCSYINILNNICSGWWIIYYDENCIKSTHIKIAFNSGRDIYLNADNSIVNNNCLSENGAKIQVSGECNTISSNIVPKGEIEILGDYSSVSGNFANGGGVSSVHIKGNHNNVNGNNLMSNSSSIYVEINSTYNLISSNSLSGKNYINRGGVTNTFVNNKFDEGV